MGLHKSFLSFILPKTEYHFRPTIVLAVFLVSSLIINLLLAQEVRSLRNLVRLIRSEEQLAVGVKVPSFTAKDLDGRLILIDYRSVNIPTVLYIFTPSCDWCTRNLPNIKHLAQESRALCRIVGLSLSSDNLRDYIREHDIDFPVYTDLPYKVTSTYKLGGTPQTIVVSSEGQVLKNWIGAYEGDLRSEVEAYFQARMPGINGH